MLSDINPQEALVSVVIPTYNRPAYLYEALSSAVRQTYRNIEIIVLDNCSPENPQVIVESFQDSRIQFWRNETNLGGFANAISAFKKAQGKYVASLHDDDVWEENFLEKLVPHLEVNPDLALAFCDHYIINSNSTIDYLATEKNTRHWKRNQLKEGIYQPFYKIGLVNQAVPSIAASVIRKVVIDWNDFPLEVGYMWDLFLTYLCCRGGHGAYYCPERLTRYRVHELSETMLRDKKDFQENIRKAKNEISCYEHFMKDERLQELKPYFKQKWADANTTLGIALIRGQQLKAARPHFLRSLSQHVSSRTIAALMLTFAPYSIASRF